MERLIGVSKVAGVSSGVAGVSCVEGRFKGWGSGFGGLSGWIGSGLRCCVVIGSSSIGADGKGQVRLPVLLQICGLQALDLTGLLFGMAFNGMEVIGGIGRESVWFSTWEGGCSIVGVGSCGISSDGESWAECSMV